jgi:hypothetical protein
MKIDNSIYNLEESFYKKGWYFLDPSPVVDEVLCMIFRNRGIAYYAPTYAFSSFTITKTIYNISAPSVETTVSMNLTDWYGCYSSSYYIPPESKLLSIKMGNLNATWCFIFSMITMSTLNIPNLSNTMSVRS